MLFSTPTKIVPLQELNVNTINERDNTTDENGNLSPMTSASKYIENRMVDIDELIIARRNEFNSLRQSNKIKFSSVSTSIPPLKVGSNIPILIKKTATITSPLPSSNMLSTASFSPTDDEIYILKNESMFLRSQLAAKSAQFAELQHDLMAKSSRIGEVETRLSEYVNYSENLRQELDNTRAQCDLLRHELQERQHDTSSTGRESREYIRLKEEWEIATQHNRDLQYQLNERDNDLSIVYEKYTIVEDNNEQLSSKLSMQLRNTDALLRLADRSRGRTVLVKHYFCRLQLHTALGKESTRTQQESTRTRGMEWDGVGTSIESQAGYRQADATSAVKLDRMGKGSSTYVLCFLAAFQCSVLYALSQVVLKLLLQEG